MEVGDRNVSPAARAHVLFSSTSIQVLIINSSPEAGPALFCSFDGYVTSLKVRLSLIATFVF